MRVLRLHLLVFVVRVVRMAPAQLARVQLQWLLLSLGCLGTGLQTRRRQLLLTCLPCLPDAAALQVTLSGGEEFSAKVVGVVSHSRVT